MQVHVERSSEDRLVRRRLVRIQNRIRDGAKDAHEAHERERAQALARLFCAATLLQACVRGGLARKLASTRRHEIFGAILIQRHMRGAWGRRVALERLWQKHSVVDSMAALKRMKRRSMPTATHSQWTELVDLETNAIWYLQAETWHSTWMRPHEMEWILSRREELFANKAKFERENQLAEQEADEIWRTAFHLAEQKKERFPRPIDHDSSTLKTSRALSSRELALLVGKKNANGSDQVEPQAGLEDGSVGVAADFASSLATRSFSDLSDAENMREKSESSVHMPALGADQLKTVIEKLYPKRMGISSRVMPSGAHMHGQVEDGDFNGFGVLSYPYSDLTVFLGHFKNNVRHGTGSLRGASGKQFYGSFVDGVREGWGMLWRPRGEHYVGEFHGGLISGIGRLTCANGDVYQGEFVDNLPHGIGRFVKANGDCYLGDIRQGVAHGRGILSFSRGEIYRGITFGSHSFFDNGLQVSLLIICVTVAACVFILMEANLLDIGSNNAAQAMVSTSQQTVITMLANGSNRSGTVMAATHLQTVNFTMASSSTTVRAAKGYISTTVATSFRALGMRTVRMVAAFTCFPMDQSTAAGGEIMTFTERVFFSLQMVRGTKANFPTTRSMAKENSLGRLGITIPDPSTMISSAAVALCGTLLATFTPVSGKATRKMEWVASSSLMATSTKVHSVLLVTGDMARIPGEFCDDVMNGVGKLVYNPGTVLEEMYDGEWKSGKRSGRGRYRYKSQVCSLHLYKSILTNVAQDNMIDYDGVSLLLYGTNQKLKFAGVGKKSSTWKRPHQIQKRERVYRRHYSRAANRAWITGFTRRHAILRRMVRW